MPLENEASTFEPSISRAFSQAFRNASYSRNASRWMMILLREILRMLSGERMRNSRTKKITRTPTARAVGVLVIFFVLLFRILSPLSILSISRNNIIIHLDAFREYEAFLNACENAREIDGSKVLASFSSGIELENVSFNYTSSGPEVLKNLSFTV